MSKQCVIVGLGMYGMNILKELSKTNIEVLAIDNDIKSIEYAEEYATKVMCVDVTKNDIWKEIPVKNFDFGVVCFGENLVASIISCMELREAGVKYIIAKVGSKTQKQILEKLDVDEIIFSEEYAGITTAREIIEQK